LTSTGIKGAAFPNAQENTRVTPPFKSRVSGEVVEKEGAACSSNPALNERLSEHT